MRKNADPWGNEPYKKKRIINTTQQSMYHFPMQCWDSSAPRVSESRDSQIRRQLAAALKLPFRKQMTRLSVGTTQKRCASFTMEDDRRPAEVDSAEHHSVFL
jgi:hypothetical protein